MQNCTHFHYGVLDGISLCLSYLGIIISDLWIGIFPSILRDSQPLSNQILPLPHPFLLPSSTQIKHILERLTLSFNLLTSLPCFLLFYLSVLHMTFLLASLLALSFHLLSTWLLNLSGRSLICNRELHFSCLEVLFNSFCNLLHHCILPCSYFHVCLYLNKISLFKSKTKNASDDSNIWSPHNSLSANSCFLLALTCSALLPCVLSKVDLTVYHRSLSWKYYLWCFFRSRIKDPSCRKNLCFLL